NWPGIGNELVDYIQLRDYAAVQGIINMLAVVVVVVRLVIDIVNALIDQRGRYGWVFSASLFRRSGRRPAWRGGSCSAARSSWRSLLSWRSSRRGSLRTVSRKYAKPATSFLRTATPAPPTCWERPKGTSMCYRGSSGEPAPPWKW